MALQEGENIGPYRILSQLGQGGMATVYRAYHPQLDRTVAIKMMHQAFLEDATFIARFKREAQIVAGLEHPHIVPVYDFAEYDGVPYLVMKYIEGRTLKADLTESALPLKPIIHIMTAVGSALAYAHEKGVLHRDIKPSNIVIDTADTPYLTDFGLARIAQAGESTMSADMLLGTPQYISPEQAKGQKNLDGRADIYSLGVVLYEMVVGRVPFSADTPYAIIHDHIYSPLPLPTVVNPDISPSVEKVLLKALAKKPEDRYDTAAQMVKAFRAAIQQDHVTTLNPDRVSVAAVSLAKMRDAEEYHYEIAAPHPGIPAPGVPVSGSARTRQEPTAQARRFWIAFGLIALLVVCMLSLVVTLSAADNIRQLNALSQANQQGSLVNLVREFSALPFF